MFSSLESIKLGFIRGFEIIWKFNICALNNVVSSHSYISNEFFYCALSSLLTMMDGPELICHVVLYPHVNSSLAFENIDWFSVYKGKTFSQVTSSNACNNHIGNVVVLFNELFVWKHEFHQIMQSFLDPFWFVLHVIVSHSIWTVLSNFFELFLKFTVLLFP